MGFNSTCISQKPAPETKVYLLPFHQTVIIMSDDPKMSPEMQRALSQADQQGVTKEHGAPGSHTGQHVEQHGGPQGVPSQEVKDRKNQEFGQNQPSYDQGQARRQDPPANLRSEPQQPSTPQPANSFAQQPAEPGTQAQSQERANSFAQQPPEPSAQAQSQERANSFSAQAPPSQSGQSQTQDRSR